MVVEHIGEMSAPHERSERDLLARHDAAGRMECKIWDALVENKSNWYMYIDLYVSFERLPAEPSNLYIQKKTRLTKLYIRKKNTTTTTKLCLAL